MDAELIDILEPDDVFTIGNCYDCGYEVDERVAVITHLRIYHEACAARLWPEMESNPGGVR